MKKLLLVLFFISTCAIAQDIPDATHIETLKINLDKGTISGLFPFDEYIKLDISSKSNELAKFCSLIKVAFVEQAKVPSENTIAYRRYLRIQKRIKKKEEKLTKLNNDPNTAVIDSTSLKKLNLKLKNKSVSLYSFEQEKIEVKKISDGKYTALLTPLNPNQLYELVFAKKLNSDQINDFYEILHRLYQDDTLAAKKLYHEKLITLEKEKYRAVPYNFLPKFDSLKSDMETLNPILKKLDSLNFVVNPATISDSIIEDIGNKLKLKEIETSNFSNLIFEYIPVGTNDIRKVFNGIKQANSRDTLAKHQYNKRLKNLISSLQKTSELNVDLMKLLTLNATDSLTIDFYQNQFLPIQNSIRINRDSLQKETKIVSNIINSKYNFSDVITNSTYGTGKKEKNVTYLTSDFGFINSLGPDPFGEIEYIGRPYFGLNYHIGGYNKNKKISQVAKKRFGYRFSLAIGVTLGDINEGGYKDLFSNLSPSVGFNYRLAQDVRLGTGVLLLKEDRNPIIDREGLAVLPYVSISFDYSLLADLVIASRIFK